MFYAPSRTGGLKFKKASGTWEASNVMFNPERMVATSFEWWYFVKRIGGKVVFNDYSYSSFTTRHQRKVQNKLAELGIKVDVYVEARKGLQDLPQALRDYEARVESLLSAMQRPGTRKAKNAERAGEVTLIQEKIKTVKALIAAEARNAN